MNIYLRGNYNQSLQGLSCLNKQKALNFSSVPYTNLSFAASQALKANRLVQVPFMARQASEEQKIKVLKTRINNFDKVAPGIYRGSYPLAKSSDALKLLADLGIKTIIDLREDRQMIDVHSKTPYAKLPDGERKTIASRLNKEYQQACEKLGIKRVRIPFDLDKVIIPGLVEGNNKELENSYCQFVEEMKKAQKPVYIHCSCGQGRTSFMMILYRIFEMGIGKEKAIHETDPYLTPSGKIEDLNACRELLQALLAAEPDFSDICHKKIAKVALL